METTLEEVKVNTVIIGTTLLYPHPSPHRTHFSVSSWGFWGLSKEEGTSPSFSPVCYAINGYRLDLQTFPALFGLYRMGFLPKDVKIVGYARTKMDEAEYHKRITSYIKTDDQEALDQFKALMESVPRT